MGTVDPLHQHALTIWRAGVRAAGAGLLLRAAVSVDGDDLRLGSQHVDLSAFDEIVVIGAGKACAPMVTEFEAALGPELLRAKSVRGWVNVPEWTLEPTRAITLHAARATHVNRPTPEGQAGAERIIEIVHELGPRSLLVCLFTGGGSALLPAPVPEVGLEAVHSLTGQLHRSGAPIEELNCVLKHLSLLKGGRLLEIGDPGRVVSLLISDVVGDRLDLIASGPTVSDPSTFEEALAVLERRGLTQDTATPPEVVHYLHRGALGERPETLGALPPHVSNEVIGSNVQAVAGAVRRAQSLGYHVVDLGSGITGEAADVGRMLAELAITCRDRDQPCGPPLCVVAGGETTVTLPGKHGIGGRNQEAALAAVMRLAEAPGGARDIVVLCGGTDGEDGPTDAAGAVASEEVLRRTAAERYSAGDSLARHDSHTYFSRVDGLMRVGDTGANVADLSLALVGPPPVAEGA